MKDKFKSSWAQYTVVLPDDVNRELLQEKLKLKNVPTAIYYPIPLNDHKPYNHFPVSKAGLETTYKLSKTVLSLPMHTEMDNEIQYYITNKVKDFFKQ